MKLRLFFSALVVLVPWTLKGGDSPAEEATPNPPVSTVSGVDSPATGKPDSFEWLAFDLSPEQLEADYQRSIGAERSVAADELRTRVARGYPLREAVMIPVVFLADAQQDDDPLAADEHAEPPAEPATLEERMRALELENAELKALLERLEPAIEPVEPFVDPDWPPVQEPPKRRLRFLPRPAPPAFVDRPVGPPIVALGREIVRFQPFTRAAMDAPSLGWTSPERARSLKEQRRFFQNASKSIGTEVGSREYRGVRLEVEKAVLRGELNARYAAQYLADVVDVFRTYERLARFGLAGPVAPPMSAYAFSRDPGLMFGWASEVNEQKRRINLD